MLSTKIQELLDNGDLDCYGFNVHANFEDRETDNMEIDSVNLAHNQDSDDEADFIATTDEEGEDEDEENEDD